MAFCTSLDNDLSTKKRQRTSVGDMPESPIISVSAQTTSPNLSFAWFFDLGASRYISGYISDFSSLIPVKGNITITS